MEDDPGVLLTNLNRDHEVLPFCSLLFEPTVQDGRLVTAAAIHFSDRGDDPPFRIHGCGFVSAGLNLATDRAVRLTAQAGGGYVEPASLSKMQSKPACR